MSSQMTITPAPSSATVGGGSHSGAVPVRGDSGFSSEAILARFEHEHAHPHHEPDYGLPPADWGWEIPTEYGDTKLCLLVRDPEWVYAYWEINDHDRARFGLPRGRASRAMAIRIYDVTSGGDAARPGAGYVDIPINATASNWYLRLAPLRSYVADLGFYDELGRFVTVARSNAILTPRNEPSHEVDADWMIVEQDFEAIYTASGGRVIERTQIGSEFVTRITEFDRHPGRFLTFPLGASEKMFQVPLTGASENLFSGSGGVAAAKAPAKQKNFWLQVATEVVLYGATEPDATVTVMGRKIQLRPDGTFTLRFAFPEGSFDLPVVAVNADGDMQKSITPVVERRTKDVNL